MTWAEEFARLADLDDSEEFYAEHGRLKAIWQEEYAQAFIEIAMSRGWSRENAATWPSELGYQAFIESYVVDHSHCPRRRAEIDVMACEEAQ
jgi:hypothetical protein